MSFDEVTPSLAEVLERHPRWRISFSGRARAWWVGAVGASLTVAVIVRGDVLAVAAAAVVGVGVARTWLAGRGDRIRRARMFDRRSVHQVRLDLSSPALAVCVDRAGGRRRREVIGQRASCDSARRPRDGWAHREDRGGCAVSRRAHQSTVRVTQIPASQTASTLPQTRLRTSAASSAR